MGRSFHALPAAVLLPALAAVTALAQPESLTGKVTAVSEGAVLTLSSGEKESKIRLHGIAVPAADQPHAGAAKERVGRETLGKSVRVRVVDRDTTGAVLGVVEAGAENGEPTKAPGSLNHALVAAGLAWWDHQQAPGERSLAEAEIDARAARRGLWADANPVPPWAWRSMARAEKSRPGTVSPAPDVPSAGGTVYVTQEADRFHRASCRYVRKSKIPLSRLNAQANGYQPCRVCRP